MGACCPCFLPSSSVAYTPVATVDDAEVAAVVVAAPPPLRPDRPRLQLRPFSPNELLRIQAACVLSYNTRTVVAAGVTNKPGARLRRGVRCVGCNVRISCSGWRTWGGYVTVVEVGAAYEPRNSMYYFLHDRGKRGKHARWSLKRVCDTDDVCGVCDGGDAIGVAEVAVCWRCAIRAFGLHDTTQLWEWCHAAIRALPADLRTNSFAHLVHEALPVIEVARIALEYLEFRFDPTARAAAPVHRGWIAWTIVDYDILL